MRTGSEGRHLIEHFEGRRLYPYRDSIGKWTIGVGHLILNNEWERFKNGITNDECERLLTADLIKSERSVNRLVTVPLTQNQFDALISFTFNLGGGALQCSTLRQRLNRGDYAVGNEFRKWVYAGGVKFNGLIRRRAAEFQLFQL